MEEDEEHEALLTSHIEFELTADCVRNTAGMCAPTVVGVPQVTTAMNASPSALTAPMDTSTPSLGNTVDHLEQPTFGDLMCCQDVLELVLNACGVQPLYRIATSGLMVGLDLSLAQTCTVSNPH